MSSAELEEMYAKTDVRELAATVLCEHAALVQVRLRRFNIRKEERRCLGADAVPMLVLCGYSGAGKDLTAEWLRDMTRVQFHGGTSRTLHYLLCVGLGIAPVDVTTQRLLWESRHVHRAFWFQFGQAINAEDATLIAKLNLGTNDVLVGLRAAEEFEACRAAGVFDLAVWIDAGARVPVDPTVTFTADHCDVVLRNHGSVADLYQKVDRLAAALRLT